MAIRDKIKKIKKDMLIEIDDVANVSKDVQDRALAAVHGGQESAAWRTYMELFVEAGNTKQLARLLGKDSTKDRKEMNEARAYLVADGTCGLETVTKFGNGASLVLDQGVEAEAPVDV